MSTSCHTSGSRNELEGMGTVWCTDKISSKGGTSLVEKCGTDLMGSEFCSGSAGVQAHPVKDEL